MCCSLPTRVSVSRICQKTIEGMVERPKISNYVEDYVIFQVNAAAPADVLSHAQDLARILRSEEAVLSEQEVREATSHWLSFGKEDVAIIDWNASLLFGDAMEDVQAVLEFANVELLEMRALDQQLDDASIKPITHFRRESEVALDEPARSKRTYDR